MRSVLVRAGKIAEKIWLAIVWGWAALVGIAALIIIATMMFSPNTPPPSTAGVLPSADHAQSLERFTVEEVYRKLDYRPLAGPNDFERELDKREIIVVGTLNRTMPAKDDQFFVWLDNALDRFGARFFLRAGFARQVSAIRMGETVEVICKGVYSSAGTVSGIDCRLP